MRRKDRAMTHTDFLHAVLNEASEVSIGFNTGSAPYVLMVNFVFHRGAIWFHCANAGMKLDLLAADPRVGFTTATGVYVEGDTTRYKSICGTGVAEVVTDPVEKEDALVALSEKYKSTCQFPTAPKMLAMTCLVRIDIETLTGKQSKSV